MFKKFSIIISLIAMLGMASCTTTINSARTEHFSSPAITMTIADLEVSPKKITYTYRPTDDVNRGGEVNVINEDMLKSAVMMNSLQSNPEVRKKVLGIF